jgi:O-antigen/teichoic acid export membrane protein
MGDANPVAGQAVPQQKRGIAANIGVNFIGQSIPLLVGIVSIPGTLAHLGTARFGILALAWVITQYFAIFDFGLSRATTKFVAEALGRGEGKEIPGLVGTAVTLQLGLGLVGGVGLGLVASPLVSEILSVPNHLVDEARAGFQILAFGVPLLLLSASLRALLEAGGQFVLVNMVRTPLSTLNFLLPLIGSILGYGLRGILLSLVVSQGVAVVVQYVLCVRVFPTLSRRPRYDSIHVRPLLGYGGWITVSTLISPILVYIDRFVVGALISVSAVAYYAPAHEMALRALIVPGSMVAVLFPALSSLSGTRRPGLATDLAGRWLYYLLLVLGPLVVALVWLASDLIELWLGASFVPRSSLAFQILAVGVLMNSVAAIPFTLLHARGRPDIPAKFHILELPFQIVVAWLFVLAWGLPGAAAAYLIRVSIDAGLLLVAVRRSSSPEEAGGGLLPRRTVTALLGFLVASGGAGILSDRLPGSSQRVVVLCLGLLVAAVVSWRFGLRQEEREAAQRSIGALFGKRSSSGATR